MNATHPSTHCPRCQLGVASDDRYCRSCGYALSARPEYSQDLHRTVIEAVPVGLFTLDLSARIRLWNRAMETQTGKKRRDVLGRVVFDILPHLQPHAHRVMRVADSALPIRLDHISRMDEHGAPCAENYWFGPLLQEDGSAALLGVMEDITQKVKVDNQLIRSERLAAIGELAAGVAHNFNNILAAIGGDAQLLKFAAEEEGLPAHVSETAQQICDETMRGGRVAHDLLSFARGADPQICRVDVGETARDAVRLIRNHPAFRAVIVELALGADLPQVEADPNLLHQVFFNLILNALQAMPNGGTLTISAIERTDGSEAAAGMLDIKFSDTGTGIPREQLRRVFDPFYSQRADGGTGSGLGLPVSLAMVKSVGGDIQIASAEGIGTTVTVSLPVIEVPVVPRAGFGPQRRGRALVVDDDANVRRTLTTLLSRRGFEIVTATDAEEAISRFDEAAGTDAIDVVLMELLVPRGGGAALARHMRAQQTSVPLIVLTGAPDPQQQLQMLEEGAAVCFTKPPSYSELLHAVERLTPARQVGSEVFAGDAAGEPEAG